MGMAMAACILLILVVAGVLVSGWLRLRNESEQLASERAELLRQKAELNKLSDEQRKSTGQLTAELQQVKTKLAEEQKFREEWQRAKPLKETPPRQPLLSTLATIVLRPVSVRSGRGNPSRLTLRPGTTTARLQLELEKNDYPAYNVTVRAVDDDTIVFQKNGLRPRQRSYHPQLLLSIPSQHLTRGDYVVHVDGVTQPGRIVGYGPSRNRIVLAPRSESVSDYPLQVITEK
jgi:hypothetical protein